MAIVTTSTGKTYDTSGVDLAAQSKLYDDIRANSTYVPGNGYIQNDRIQGDSRGAWIGAGDGGGGDPAKLASQTANPGGIIAGGGTAAPAALPAPQEPQVAQLGAPTAWNVTADQTVEGRINKIINGEVGQQARAGAMGEMNERGLVNTSMAITAGQDAAYRAAIPIATNDAATFSKAAGYNADQGNQFAVRNTDYKNQYALAALSAKTQLEQANLQARTQLTTAQLSAQTQMSVAQLNADTQAQMKNLDIDFQTAANALQQANKTLLDTNGQAATAMNTAMSAISNIQNNNQMDATTKTRAIAQVWADVQTQLKVLGSVSGLNLTASLNFADMPGFDAQGNYIGFPDATPEPTAAPTPGGDGSGGSIIGSGN